MEKSNKLKKSKIQLDLLEQIQNMTLSQKSKVFNEIIIFLFNEFINSNKDD